MEPPVDPRNALRLTVETVRDLHVKAGFGVDFKLEPLSGGRNNRVFRLRTGDKELLLKVYFRHRDDHRDRLRQEFAFLQYLWSNGVRAVPEPIAADYRESLGLYEFVPGRQLVLQEIQPRHIDQAIAVYLAANLQGKSAQAEDLLPASEACFSIAEHLESVGKRVDRLNGIEVGGDVDADTRRFVLDELEPFWSVVSGEVKLEYERNGLLQEELVFASRCLSPSDFGFHNALLEEPGVVRFLDFEYAGWDDPAKLVCDFANQPDMLLSEELSRKFQEAVIREDPCPEVLRQRICYLTPVYQIKWACIILNDFLPLGRDRALFIQPKERSELRMEQLMKARQMLARAVNSHGKRGVC
jgi:hypothetical protein